MKVRISGVKTASEHKVGTTETAVIDFGVRTVSRQNFSNIVALPKSALTNCGDDVRQVNVKLVQTGTEKYLKLTPVAAAEAE